SLTLGSLAIRRTTTRPVIILVVLAGSSRSFSRCPQRTSPVWPSAIAHAFTVVYGGPSSASGGCLGVFSALTTSGAGTGRADFSGFGSDREAPAFEASGPVWALQGGCEATAARIIKPGRSRRGRLHRPAALLLSMMRIMSHSRRISVGTLRRRLGRSAQA